MWKEEEHGDEAVNMNRFREASRTGAETVAVGCPFCLTMLTDARNQAGDGPQVKESGRTDRRAAGLNRLLRHSLGVRDS